MNSFLSDKKCLEYLIKLISNNIPKTTTYNENSAKFITMSVHSMCLFLIYSSKPHTVQQGKKKRS